MGRCNVSAVKSMAKRIALGQALAFLMSVTGVSTTKLVNNNASYSLLQSVTAYLFLLIVYFPAYLFLRYRYREIRFANFTFLDRWYKYAILAIVDLEANYCVVLAYQYTDMMSVQLLSCFTVPCVLLLSFFILKMKFALTHIAGCIIAVGGLCMLIVLDSDGLSSNVSGKNQVIGDVLCLVSSALYATSNVLTEWFIKPKKTQVLIDASASGPADESQRCREDSSRIAMQHCEPAMEDERFAASAFEEGGDDLGQEAPNVPAFVPVVENIAMMSLFAVTFATVQFFILEWKTFKPNRGNWTGEDWLFQIVFGLTMLCVYTGMPTLFLVSSAAFANISLLTANVYAIIWNVTVFGIYPTKLFFVPYILIVVGILLYNLTDVVKIPCCKRFNYVCGEVVEEHEKGSRRGEAEGHEMDNRCHVERE